MKGLRTVAGFLYFSAIGLASLAPLQREASADAYVRQAERGSASAQKTLGFLLAEGAVVPANPAAAIPWLLRSAMCNDVEAAVRLADLYREARGILPKLQEAARWYSAAAPVDVYAAWRLGQLYEAGSGVAQDMMEAARLYTQAAHDGLASAQNSLANLYMAGIGVPQDYSAAREWYRRAAHGGYADALLNLAGMYYNGLGVPRDYPQALALARAASDSRARDAASFLQAIETKMAETDKPTP